MVSRQVVTLANSIVGVSVLAMPFCFKQCGIILASLLLMTGAILTRMVCYFLLKAATITRRRTYELLAYHTFGQAGKFMVEISIIGFLIGTMIAFMVVMGDLGPEILSEMFTVENNSSLRTIIMTTLSLFVALPLGLLRNMDSLSSVSTASVLFYVFLVCKILSDGMGSLWSGSYLDKIDYWRPAGVLQSIPIFSMALSCQTQIFGIYDSLPEPSLQKMNEIVKQAINVCTFFYFCVGFFGYIAFCTQNFGGNILLSFGPSWSTQLIKICFLMSIVFSCPLVIFPCRASLHSLIFRRIHMHHHVHDMSTNYIPDSRLKLLTVGIVAFTLVVGLIIPNIELVLGLVGSTTGSVICIIFPSIMFIRVTSKNTTERLLAQTVFFVGVMIMVLTTYVTLYAVEKSQVNDLSPIDQIRMTEAAHKGINDGPQVELTVKSSEKFGGNEVNHISVEFQPKIPVKMISKNEMLKTSENKMPLLIPSPIPDRISSSAPAIKVPPASEVDRGNPNSNIKVNDQQDQVQVPAEQPVAQNPINAEKIVDKNEQLVADRYKPPEIPPDTPIQDNKQRSGNVETPLEDNVAKAQQQHVVAQEPVVISDAKLVEKPKVVIAEKPQEVAEPVPDKKEFVEKLKAEEFLKKLEEHQENQKKILEEQKEILAELKQHHAADVVRDGAISHNKNDPHGLQPELKDKDKAVSPDPIQTKEKQIIDKLSENLETEKRNEELLQKLEDGLNKEIKEIEKNPKSHIVQSVQAEVDKNIVPEKVEKILQKVESPVIELVPKLGEDSLRKRNFEPPAAVKKSVLQVLPPSAHNTQEINMAGKTLPQKVKEPVIAQGDNVEPKTSKDGKLETDEQKQKAQKKAEREM